MTQARNRPNWIAGLIAAVAMSVVFALLWEDWFFGAAIGVMLGIVAAFVLRGRRSS